jgi:Na+/glutamate symporter
VTSLSVSADFLRFRNQQSLLVDELFLVYFLLLWDTVIALFTTSILAIDPPLSIPPRSATSLSLSLVRFLLFNVSKYR